MPGQGDGFVGRAVELGRLAEACRDVRAGRGRVLVVSGAAGVGKTRLAERGEALAREAGLRVAWGRCWTGGGAPALWPWPPVLAELCGRAAAALLADDDAGTAVVDPERFARFVAVGERLAAACAATPAYLVLDDLHGAEPAALLLTRYLARLRPRPALLLVVTARDGPGAAELAADLEATSLPLRDFDLADTRAFLAAQCQAGVEPALTRAAHQVTGGNPLQLQRLVALARADPAGAFPDGLRNLVGESVGRIPAPARALVATAAVLGPAPSVALTAAVAGRPAEAVLDAVAAAPGLVAQTGPDQLAFTHDLVRDALTGLLSAGSCSTGTPRRPPCCAAGARSTRTSGSPGAPTTRCGRRPGQRRTPGWPWPPAGRRPRRWWPGSRTRRRPGCSAPQPAWPPARRRRPRCCWSGPGRCCGPAG